MHIRNRQAPSVRLRAGRSAAHNHLTLTALYNVLVAIRAGRALTPQERDIHDAGQVSILRALHDRLDEAVAAACGWPADIADSGILARLVALNAERRAEEAAGLVRWLRPDFQAPEAAPPAAQPRTAIVQPETTEAPAQNNVLTL